MTTTKFTGSGDFVAVKLYDQLTPYAREKRLSAYYMVPTYCGHSTLTTLARQLVHRQAQAEAPEFTLFWEDKEDRTFSRVDTNEDVEVARRFSGNDTLRVYIRPTDGIPLVSGPTMCKLHRDGEFVCRYFSMPAGTILRELFLRIDKLAGTRCAGGQLCWKDTQGNRVYLTTEEDLDIAIQVSRGQVLELLLI